jgi:hypothetical protein
VFDAVLIIVNAYTSIEFVFAVGTVFAAHLGVTEVPSI